MKRRNIMIFGGEFYNKGAQAMSFITISRLKSQFPDYEIIFVSELDSRRPASEIENYNFKMITNPFGRNNFIGENLIRKAFRRNEKPNPKEVRHLLDNTDYLFDISGYELSSQWGKEKSEVYLDRLKIAHEKGIKTVILPQSIGPFDYGEHQDKMVNMLRDVLKEVEIIMPREPQGEQALNKIGIKDNVIHFTDIVLTNKEPINWNVIYKKQHPEKEFNIEPNSVGIIPNMRNFDHGNEEIILNLYKETVSYLRSIDKPVYLSRHSDEDIKACHLIKEMFPNDSGVHVIEDDMTPTEFENMVSQFDFTIGSRFHSVIHSFKVGVPTLVLGWAVKYQELAKLFEQEKYVFDVREEFEVNDFVNAVKEMDNNLEFESKKINKQLNEMQQYEDPFEYTFKQLKI